MREIKFRIWWPEEKTFSSPFDLRQLILDSDGYSDFDEDCILDQFTGLTDKNGREIYEGDILQIPLPIITWKIPENGIVEVKWMGAGFYPLSSDLSCIDGGEVIGNIHQNPELLKKE